MYSQRLSKEKARIKVPSTRTAITSPSPIESIHSSTSTHSSHTLSPTISNTSNESSNVSSTDTSSNGSNGSRSRSSSTENVNNNNNNNNKYVIKQERTIQKEKRTEINVIKNEPKNANQPSVRTTTRTTTERRRRLSDPRCFPLLYECYAQARVRIGYELSSQHLTDLPQGSIVTVEEIHEDNRRARISAPIHGWLSITSKNGGNTILMPLNKQTAKIGGKVMFNYNHYHHQNHGNNHTPITAKIIDYNQNYDMHKVQHKNGKHEWLNLKDKSITYIPNGVPMMVNPIKQTEKFFLQFFMKDYPEFVPRQSKNGSNRNNDNNNNHYNASVQQSRAQQLHQSQLLHQLHQKQMQQRANNKYSHSCSKQFKLNGHNHTSRSVSYSGHGHNHSRNGQKILHQLNAQNHHYQQNHRYHNNGTGINRNQNDHRYNHNNNNNDDKVRYNALNTMNDLNGKRNNKVECKDDIKSDKENMDKPQNGTTQKKEKTSPEEFRRKIKEIERKIIDHLHKRGYYEDSKEFWIYIRKAKEMAIEKAKKERAKYLAREKAEAEAREKAKINKIEDI